MCVIASSQCRVVAMTGGRTPYYCILLLNIFLLCLHSGRFQGYLFRCASISSTYPSKSVCPLVRWSYFRISILSASLIAQREKLKRDDPNYFSILGLGVFDPIFFTQKTFFDKKNLFDPKNFFDTENFFDPKTFLT